jgi:hypothetical protein
MRQGFGGAGPAARRRAAPVSHDPHRAPGFRPVAPGQLERSPDVRGRPTPGDYRGARRPERGVRGAHHSQHPHQQDLRAGPGLAEPFHPRRPVQGFGEYGLPEPDGIYRRPGGGGLRQHQIHRDVRPQHLRGPGNQGHQPVAGRPGARGQADLHRPPGQHHRGQVRPLPDDPAGP